MEKTFKVARWLASYSASTYMIPILYYTLAYVVLIINHKISIYTIPIPIATFLFTMPLFVGEDVRNTIGMTGYHARTNMLVKNLNIGTFFSTLFKNEVNIKIHETEQT